MTAEHEQMIFCDGFAQGPVLWPKSQSQLRIPEHSDHRFRSIPITDSGAKPITDSGANWTVIPVGNRSLFRFAPERCKGPEIGS